MSWKSYDLDRIAQKLVLKYRHHDVLNESHKMRMNVAYGLERFWGEHLRLNGDTEGKYWKDVWDALANDILVPAQILLPNDLVILEDTNKGKNKQEKTAIEARNTDKIEKMANKLWTFSKDYPYEQRVALSVLTQLCDCLVWWTQRYKPVNKSVE
jgi:hypothetical protein